MRRHLALLPVLLPVLVGCMAETELDDETLPFEGVGESVDVDDQKADEGGELRVRAEGMTVWMRPRIESRALGDDVGLVLRGRASRNLAGVSATLPAGPVGTARVVGLRGFEIELGPDEAHALLVGEPVWVSLDAPSAPHRYVVQLHGRARLAQFAGASTLFVESAITPVRVDGQEVHRGRARIGAGYDSLGVDTLSDSRPAVAPVARGASTFTFDFSYPRLARVMHATAPLTFTARGRVGSAVKTAYLQAVLSSVSVTHGDPAEAWPPAGCDDTALACLDARGLAGDTTPCGSALEVRRCVADLEPDLSPAERFADDLRAHLEGWYAVRGGDVTAAGGNDFASARAAVSAAAVYEITDPEDDPLGHDLGRVLLLAHPDVAFPGSDRVWLGAYDRSSGARVELVDFN